MKANRTLLFRAVLMLALVGALPVFGYDPTEYERMSEPDSNLGTLVAYGLGGVVLITFMCLVAMGSARLIDLLLGLFRGKPKV